MAQLLKASISYIPMHVYHILCSIFFVFWVMHTSMFNGIGQDNCILFGYSDFMLQGAMIASIRGLKSEISVPPTKMAHAWMILNDDF